MRASSSAWSDLRSLRSSPPGFAGQDPQRRGVFSAALQQSEELLRGAEQLGYASRPLYLFYGLSQAGRAIAAAWSPRQFGVPDGAWLLRGHGISVIGSSLDGPLEYILLRNQPPEPLPAPSSKPLPAFPAVARALSSDSLLQPVALVDLWAALPEAAERPAPGAGSRWRPLSLSWDEQETNAIAAWLGPLPDKLVNRPYDLLADTDYTRVFAELRSHYPDMWQDDDAIEIDGYSVEPGRAAVWLKWTSPSVWKASLEQRLAVLAYVRRDFEARLPIYRSRPWAFPRLQNQNLHPIVIWWAVLYAMSMLARYHPESWARTIDVDNSSWSVPLEHILDQALAVVPEIIYEALSQRPEPPET